MIVNGKEKATPHDIVIDRPLNAVIPAGVAGTSLAHFGV
jgi:hypothetical protein